MREVLEKVLAREDLTREEAKAAFLTLIDDTVTPSQVGALLTALRMKGETPVEIMGFVEAMRERAVKVDLSVRPIVDTCGTGGDRSGSFNISTMAALVVAGVGQPVAKHGNRAVSSRCGSADFLETLGIRVGLDPQAVKQSLEETGFAFLMAPHYHPATRQVAGIRRELKVETVFNSLGPLTNPVSPEFQLVGVSSLPKGRRMAEVLRLMNKSRAFVVHNEMGYDEMTPCGRNWVIEVANGANREFIVEAADCGVSPCRPEDLRGGAPEDNARIGMAILKGERGPKRDTTLINAGMALWAAGRASDLKEGMEQAAESIDSGRAFGIVDSLRRLFPYDGASPLVRLAWDL
ncbi:MAG: anthranilate phosphoribosyltransferase [Acidobacteria bacterium]|nr:anthranilate phosphoribosyltransferase [Acidobacteriota bacterium]